MSDLRYDPVFNVWTAIAEIRRDRPLEFVPIEQSLKQLICPFCSGNEDETPPSLLLLDQQGQTLKSHLESPWISRVIPNKYPTYFQSDGDGGTNHGPYRRSTAVGDQELIIPSPRHVFSYSELGRDEFTIGLLAAQQRIASKKDSPSIKHTTLFGNCRYEAGASVAHVHFQLIGSPIVSPILESRAIRFRESRTKEKHVMQQVLEFELKERTRIVGESDEFVMFCPLASRQAFQVWIVPRQSGTPFRVVSRNGLAQIGELSQHCLRRVESLLNYPAYNWILHQLPYASESDDYWFIEIIPRITKSAGYELGTDIWVNPVAPEAAARRLR